MRDPLIRKADAWADFLNGIFLRKVWREPLAADKPALTIAPELPRVGSNSLSFWSQSHTKLSDWSTFHIPTDINKNADALTAFKVFARLEEQRQQPDSPTIAAMARHVEDWSLASRRFSGAGAVPPCVECGTPSKGRYCLVCNDRNRDRKTIMVVDSEEAIREAHSHDFKGVFHWLRVNDSQDGLVQRLQENKDSTAMLALRNDPERTDSLISWFRNLEIKYSVWKPGITMPNGTPTFPRTTETGGSSFYT